jgi:drug/metabolite transporter (DMT)-like permease
MLARRSGNPLEKAFKDSPSQPRVRACRLRPWPPQKHCTLHNRRAVEEDTKQLVTQDPTAGAVPGWKQGLAPLLVVSVLWGSYTPSIRYLYALDPSISPALLTALRTCLSALVLVAASLSTWASQHSAAAQGSKPSKAALQQVASLDAVSNLKRTKPLQPPTDLTNVGNSSSSSRPVNSTSSSSDTGEPSGSQVRATDAHLVETQAPPDAQLGSTTQVSPRQGQGTAAAAAAAAAASNPAAAVTIAAVAAAGLELGCYNFVGTALQALGLELTTSLKAAFLTQTTAVLTPCFAWLGGQAVRPHHWAACGVALLGSCLITLDGLLGSPSLSSLLPPAAGQQQQQHGSSYGVSGIQGTATTSSSSSSVGEVAGAWDRGDVNQDIGSGSSSSSSGTGSTSNGGKQHLPAAVAAASGAPSALRYVPAQPGASAATGVVIAAGLQDSASLPAPDLLAEPTMWGGLAISTVYAADGSSSSSSSSSSTGPGEVGLEVASGISVLDTNSSSSSGGSSSASLGLTGVHLPPDVPPAAVLVGPAVNAAAGVAPPPALEAPPSSEPAVPAAAAAAVGQDGVYQQQGESSKLTDRGTDSGAWPAADATLIPHANTADEVAGYQQQDRSPGIQQQQQQQEEEGKGSGGPAGSSLAGELYVLGACCCYALATVRLSVIAPHHDPVQLATAKTLVLAAASTGWWLVQGLQPLANSLAAGNASSGTNSGSSSLEPLGASLGDVGALSGAANAGMVLSTTAASSSSSGVDGAGGMASATTLLHAAWEQLAHPVTSGQLPAALTSGVGLGVLLYSAWGPGSLAAVLQAKGQASVQASQAQVRWEAGLKGWRRGHTGAGQPCSGA